MALDQHQRPTAVLFRDPFALHRNYYDGEPDGKLDEWTSWDFALATATQAIIDGTTEFGNLRWEVDDDDADIDVIHEVDREREAIASVQDVEGYKPDPGEWLRPVIRHPYWDPESGEPEPFQTRTAWIEKMMKREQELRN